MDKALPTESAPTTVEESYRGAIAFMEQLCDDMAAKRPLPATTIYAVVDRLCQAIDAHSSKLIGLTAQTAEPNFLLSHSVNTAILAMVTARALGHEGTRLRDVGAVGLLHDIGLTPMVTGDQQSKVSYADVVNHMDACLTLIAQSPELRHLRVLLEELVCPADLAATLQDTLPSGHQLTDVERELRKTLRLADLYDSLTHTRAENTKPIAFTAVRSILRAHGLFEQDVARVFFDQVGIYPLGTWVRLNTGDVGVVDKVQEGLPLRPFVKAMYDRGGGKYATPKMVDLAADPLFFIKESLEEEPRGRSCQKPSL
jgi:hypothetical protein